MKSQLSFSPKANLNGKEWVDEADNSGIGEYFKKYWCWCIHPDHHVDVDHFHRMMMRFIDREECVPYKVLFEKK